MLQSILNNRQLFFLFLFWIIFDLSSNQHVDSNRSPIQLQQITSFPTSSEFFFGRISDMDVLPNENFLILDGKVQKLYEFNQRGSLVSTIAREGRGPGEISGAHSNSLEAGQDGIAIYDLRNAKMVFWNEKGNYVKDYSTPTGWGTSISWNNELLLFKRNRFRPDEQGNHLIEYSKVNLKNGDREILGTVPLKQGYETEYSCVFCPWTATNQNTIVTSKNDTTYIIYEITPDGELKHKWTRSGLAPVKYSENELEKIQRRRETSPVAYPAGKPLPVFKNRFKNIQIDYSGRI